MLIKPCKHLTPEEFRIAAHSVIDDLEAEVALLKKRNAELLNSASIWRNRAIAAEEELREGGRGIDLRRGFEL